jgi:hypothetical protein
MVSPAFRVLGGACLSTLLLCLAWQPAHADDTMRCGTHLVSEGDGKDKVRTLCGEPTSISFEGYVGGPVYYEGRYYDYWYPVTGWTARPVEVWTYNFGPNKFLRKLRFVGDELAEIRTHGYGY